MDGRKWRWRVVQFKHKFFILFYFISILHKINKKILWKKISCNWMQICGVCYSFDILHNLFYIQMRSYFNIFYCSAISYCVRYIHTNKNDFAFAKLKMTSYYKRSHKLADIICFKRLGVIFFFFASFFWFEYHTWIAVYSNLVVSYADLNSAKQ